MPARRGASSQRPLGYCACCVVLLSIGWAILASAAAGGHARHHRRQQWHEWMSALAPLLLAAGAHVANCVVALSVAANLLASLFRGTAPRQLSHQDWCCCLLAATTLGLHPPIASAALACGAGTVASAGLALLAIRWRLLAHRHADDASICNELGSNSDSDGEERRQRSARTTKNVRHWFRQAEDCALCCQIAYLTSCACNPAAAGAVVAIAGIDRWVELLNDTGQPAGTGSAAPPASEELRGHLVRK